MGGLSTAMIGDRARVLRDGRPVVLRTATEHYGAILNGAFDYVASGAHAREPQFQRFVQARAERLREQGVAVDLWR